MHREQRSPETADPVLACFPFGFQSDEIPESEAPRPQAGVPGHSPVNEWEEKCIMKDHERCKKMRLIGQNTLNRHGNGGEGISLKRLAICR